MPKATVSPVSRTNRLNPLPVASAARLNGVGRATAHDGRTVNSSPYRAAGQGSSYAGSSRVTGAGTPLLCV